MKVNVHNLQKQFYTHFLYNYYNAVELQLLKHLWCQENMFETGVVPANEVNHSARSGGIIGTSFRFSLI